MYVEIDDVAFHADPVQLQQGSIPGKVEIVEVTDVTHNSLVVKASISGTGRCRTSGEGVCLTKPGCRRLTGTI